MSELPALLRSTDERTVGPARTYNSSHILLALLIIGSNGSIGRHALAEKAGVGEGAIRTMIGKLTKNEYIAVDASGCRLTPKGDRAYSEVRSRIPAMAPVSPSELTVGKKQFALVVRGVEGAVSDGIRQRDAAIIVGASGATTYIFADSRFQIPRGSADCERDFPSHSWGEIRDTLKPRDGDVVILCGSGDEELSSLGAVAAALTLLT